MRDVLFMGRVLASVTHEMQNIMAIIKESGALAEDILQINASLKSKMKHGDKLDGAFTNIREQVERGRNLMIMLNGFAHAAADFPATADLARFTGQICTLAGRMVRLKDCDFSLRIDSGPLPVRGNALLLMQSVYVGLGAFVEGCRSGDSVQLSLLKTTDGKGAPPAIRIEAAKGRFLTDTTELEGIMNELGGSCAVGEGTLTLYYAFPPQEEGGEA